MPRNTLRYMLELYPCNSSNLPAASLSVTQTFPRSMTHTHQAGYALIIEHIYWHTKFSSHSTVLLTVLLHFRGMAERQGVT